MRQSQLLMEEKEGGRVTNPVLNGRVLVRLEPEQQVSGLAAVVVPSEGVDRLAGVGEGPISEELVCFVAPDRQRKGKGEKMKEGRGKKRRTKHVLLALELFVVGHLGHLSTHLLDMSVDELVEVRVAVAVRDAKLSTEAVLGGFVELVDGCEVERGGSERGREEERQEGKEGGRGKGSKTNRCAGTVPHRPST